MNRPLFEVNGLEKSLGQGSATTAILGNVSFAAREGEFISVVGPSGCGKTTLLMCLAGLYEPDAGSVRFDGAPVNGPTHGVAIVFQDYSRSLLPWKSVIDNVIFGMFRQKTEAKDSKRARALELLEAVGLRGFEDRYPWQLSGGMQQRVAIVRGLAAQSRLLLLDEPLAAVDAQTRADMQDLLLTLAAKFKQTCVLITHDVDEAVYMADRVIVLSRRPTSVVREFKVDLGSQRDQLTTREMPHFLDIRHEVVSLIRDMRSRAAEPTT